MCYTKKANIGSGYLFLLDITYKNVLLNIVIKLKIL